jgi:hypothetical protein
LAHALGRAEKLAALNAIVVQAVTAVLEGLENPVFIAEAEGMGPTHAGKPYDAQRRQFHDRQHMIFFIISA